MPPSTKYMFHLKKKKKKKKKLKTKKIAKDLHVIRIA